MKKSEIAKLIKNKKHNIKNIEISGKTAWFNVVIRLNDGVNINNIRVNKIEKFCKKYNFIVKLLYSNNALGFREL